MSNLRATKKLFTFSSASIRFRTPVRSILPSKVRSWLSDACQFTLCVCRCFDWFCFPASNKNVLSFFDYFAIWHFVCPSLRYVLSFNSLYDQILVVFTQTCEAKKSSFHMFDKLNIPVRFQWTSVPNHFLIKLFSSTFMPKTTFSWSFQMESPLISKTGMPSGVNVPLPEL